MASNLDAPIKKSEEQNPDDAALEAIVSVVEPAADQGSPSKEDSKLLSDGDGLDAPAGSGYRGMKVAVENDQLAEQNEETEIMQALATLFDSGEDERRPSEGDQLMEDSILEALITLYVGEDQQTELDALEVVVAKSSQETRVPATVPEVPEINTRTPSGGVRFESSNGLEFISFDLTLPLKVSQLKCSARIFHRGMEIRLHNEGCLFLIDDSFIARVELMHAVSVLSTGHFAQAKMALFRQLRIGQVFVDEVMASRDRERAQLLTTIYRIRKRAATDPADAMQLFSVVQRSTNLNYIDFCELLSNSSATPTVLKEQAVKLHRIEETTERRNRFLWQFHVRFANPTHELKATLKEFCTAVVENRANSLLNMAPHSLREQLKIVPQRSIFRMHDNDVKIFHDLDQVLNREVFQKPLECLAGRWINRVKSLKPNNAIVPVVNPIYFSLCRSLEEVILEIVSRTDHSPEELLLSDRNGWHAIKNAIRWKSETSLSKCLQREYFFVVRLLKHFDPALGNPRSFDYKPRRLLGGAARASILGGLFRRLIGQPKQNPLGIADEFYVWFCLLDDVLHHVLPDNGHVLNIFEQILQNFVQLLSKATIEQMEMIRVITHSIGRFIVQIFLFVSSDKAQSYEDKKILQAQLNAINRTMLGAESTKFFRDLIDVFSSYWINRCDIIENIPSKNGLEEMEQIKKTLLAIVVVALRKNVDAEHVISLFRSLNDLIVELDDVCFDWLIKAIPELAMSGMIALKLIKPMDNKWSDTENQVYHVIEPNKFHQMFLVLLDGESCPKHCVIQVISTLLGCIHFQLERQHWTSDECLSESDQIMSSSVLISSIRSTLIYLREQEEYVSFDMFVDERINPFCKVVETCPSLSDFVKRVGMIKESFCYMRKQNEMSVAEALRLYGEQNDEDGFNAEQLQQAYEQYSDQFETYMAETVPEEDVEGKVAVLTKLLLESVQAILFKEWTAEFKRTELPKILAGVAAVWSTLVSADVSSTGKYFKPHCIQILCVLRLLRADSGEKGVSKHLAQVLTGQGKSLVLALIAAVLALTGHQVQLVCYNDYLVQRDAKDFADLFSALNLKGSIVYGTFRDMAESVINPNVNGLRMGMRSFVADLLLSEPENSRPDKPKTHVQENSVLLMDEVDVFFTKEFYGTEYYPGAFPYIPGMDKIQEQIWSLVYHENVHDAQQLTTRIKQYITSPTFQDKAQFDQFLNKGNSYDLVVRRGGKNVLTRYTNKSLFYEELEEMILDAISVAVDTTCHINFRLNDQGVIMYRYGPRFVTWTILRYKSVFNYFRLKQHDYKAKFNPEENFSHLATKPLWMGKIFTQAHAAVGVNRAVIVFFYNDKLLEEFRVQYCGQFDRLQVLTENTDADKHEHLIGEAGVAKTVTLATRGMGRGVDYKSSVAVEKNGGVHVIQSFFSLDVKEETQIRGRTARKDNRGSYELIVLDADLEANGLVDEEEAVTYAALDAARAKLALQENKDIAESIEKNEVEHLTTMKYLASFFK